MSKYRKKSIDLSPGTSMDSIKAQLSELEKEVDEAPKKPYNGRHDYVRQSLNKHKNGRPY